MIFGPGWFLSEPKTNTFCLCSWEGSSCLQIHVRVLLNFFLSSNTPITLATRRVGWVRGDTGLMGPISLLSPRPGPAGLPPAAGRCRIILLQEAADRCARRARPEPRQHQLQRRSSFNENKCWSCDQPQVLKNCRVLFKNFEMELWTQQ